MDIRDKFEWNNHTEMNKERLYKEYIVLSKDEKSLVYAFLHQNRKKILDNQIEINKKTELTPFQELKNSIFDERFEKTIDLLYTAEQNKRADNEYYSKNKINHNKDIVELYAIVKDKLSTLQVLALFYTILNNYTLSTELSTFYTERIDIDKNRFNKAVQTVVKYLKDFDAKKGIAYGKDDVDKIFTGSHKKLYTELENIEYIRGDSLNEKIIYFRKAWIEQFRLYTSKKNAEVITEFLKSYKILYEIIPHEELCFMHSTKSPEWFVPYCSILYSCANKIIENSDISDEDIQYYLKLADEKIPDNFH